MREKYYSRFENQKDLSVLCSIDNLLQMEFSIRFICKNGWISSRNLEIISAYMKLKNDAKVKSKCEKLTLKGLVRTLLPPESSSSFLNLITLIIHSDIRSQVLVWVAKAHPKNNGFTPHTIQKSAALTTASGRSGKKGQKL